MSVTRAESAQLDVADPAVWQHDRWRPMFERLRRDQPVSFCPESVYGPYWSITRYADVQSIEAQPELFSSSAELGGIAVMDALGEHYLPHFIASDRPRHTEQRRVVSPAFNPTELARMATSIRRRTNELLDHLPIGQAFDWVDRVAVELTTGMLATLFGMPWEDRRKLGYWSDWFGNIEAYRRDDLKAERVAAATECVAYFSRLWEARAAAPPGGDLISIMAHSSALGQQTPLQFMANLSLLIVGGSDTTRNSMTAMAVAFGQWPEQWALLVADRTLCANAAQELIR